MVRRGIVFKIVAVGGFFVGRVIRLRDFCWGDVAMLENVWTKLIQLGESLK
jgi:hypothetical protein